MAEYDVTRRFQTRGVRQSDNSYRFDFRHDVRFGGQACAAPAAARSGRQVARSSWSRRHRRRGSASCASEFEVKEGDAYDFFAVRDEASTRSRNA